MAHSGDELRKHVERITHHRNHHRRKHADRATEVLPPAEPAPPATEVPDARSRDTAGQQR